MAAGVLPDAAVIQAVPAVVEALCLAESGRALVAAAQPLRCLVPLLTHAAYVRADATAGPALTMGTLSVSLADLIRHLPAAAAGQPVVAVAAAMRVRQRMSGRQWCLLSAICSLLLLRCCGRCTACARMHRAAKCPGAGLQVLCAQGGDEDALTADVRIADDAAPGATEPAPAAAAPAAAAAAEQPPAGGGAAGDGQNDGERMDATDAAAPGATAAGGEGAAAAAAPVDTGVGADRMDVDAPVAGAGASGRADAPAAAAEPAEQTAASEQAEPATTTAGDRPLTCGGVEVAPPERQTGWLPGLSAEGKVLEWDRGAAAATPLAHAAGEHAQMLHNVVTLVDTLLSALPAAQNDQLRACVRPPTGLTLSPSSSVDHSV